jgi:uncharacterized protein (DUF885 family)
MSRSASTSCHRRHLLAWAAALPLSTVAAGSAAARAAAVRGTKPGMNASTNPSRNANPKANPNPKANAKANPNTGRLHAFFDRHWAEVETSFPEWSSHRGDHRFGDRLTDASPAALARRDAQARRWLAQARALPRAGLSATDRVSLDLFIDEHRRRVAMQPFTGFRTMTIGALGGAQTDLAQLLAVVPVASRAQVLQLQQRYAAVPRRVDQEIVQLRRGIALGWVPSRDVLVRALAQLDAQLAPKTEDGPFFEPMRRLPATLGDAAALRAHGRDAIERSVLPAMRRLRAFVADEYLPRAPASGALSGYPDGARVYTQVIANQTTTALTAREIHDIGGRELTRLRAEMDALIRQTRFDGDFAHFIGHLHSDPRFAYASADALLAHYRDIGKRLDAEMPKLFATLPRAPWGVRAMPAHDGADAAEYYQEPAQDGSRAGIFYANAQGWERRRTWEAETLVAHEAVPGHHLQIARALELQGLPNFRRNGGNTAYAEGWALYAETLGFDLGLYTDPYARFGHLQWQAFRAARLVVDTGYHAFGWSRERAIEFMVERTGVEREFVASEVDRYASDPGQALAYMIGKLKIDELRQRARQRLGARFQIRRFHDAVLGEGALPLDTLARRIDAWIGTESLPRKPPP